MICQGTICQETCGFVEQSDDVCGREDDILTRTWFSWPGKLQRKEMLNDAVFHFYLSVAKQLHS